MIYITLVLWWIYNPCRLILRNLLYSTEHTTKYYNLTYSGLTTVKMSIQTEVRTSNDT